MSKNFSNVYNDRKRAESYDKLEFPGTYYLAYRDLPGIIGEYVQGTSALKYTGAPGSAP